MIASNTYALIRRRIQLEAQDSEGNKFGDYSEAVVPRWMLTSKIKNAGAIKAINSGPWFQSYKDLRQAMGLRTDAINFSFNGNLFKQSGVTRVKSEGSKTEVDIGGKTEYAKSILAFQSGSYGNLLTPSTKEKNMVKTAYYNRILNIFKDRL